MPTSLSELALWLLVSVLAVAVTLGLLTWVKVYVLRARPRTGLEWWGLLSAEEQEAHDLAVLDAQAELDEAAEADAREAARFLADQVRINAQYHP